MPKTSTSALDTHLEQEVTTLTTICTITRVDGTIIRLTELDQPITVGGETYESTNGYTRTAISIEAGLDPDDVDLEGLIDDGYVTEEDIKAKLYDGAEMQIELINYESPDDGSIILKKGTLGEVLLTGSERYSAELTSMSGLFDQEVIEKTSPTCRAELGDSRCTVPLAPDLREDSTSYELGTFIRVATTTGDGDEIYENVIYECTTAGASDSSEPTFDTTVGNTTTDGTVTWTAREAWTRSAVVATVTDTRIFTITIDESRAVDDWFNLGTITFNTGNNAGETFEIKDWDQGDLEVTLFLGTPLSIQVGDSVTLKPGCDKLRATCIEKWAISGSTNFDTGNIFNFRGEPDLPGQDAARTYPDAQ